MLPGVQSESQGAAILEDRPTQRREGLQAQRLTPDEQGVASSRRQGGNEEPPGCRPESASPQEPEENRDRRRDEGLLAQESHARGHRPRGQYAAPRFIEAKEDAQKGEEQTHEIGPEADRCRPTLPHPLAGQKGGQQAGSGRRADPSRDQDDHAEAAKIEHQSRDSQGIRRIGAEHHRQTVRQAQEDIIQRTVNRGEIRRQIDIGVDVTGLHELGNHQQNGAVGISRIAIVEHVGIRPECERAQIKQEVHQHESQQDREKLPAGLERSLHGPASREGADRASAILRPGHSRNGRSASSTRRRDRARGGGKMCSRKPARRGIASGRPLARPGQRAPVPSAHDRFECAPGSPNIRAPPYSGQRGRPGRAATGG